MFAFIIEIILELLLQLFGEFLLEFVIRTGARIPWVNAAATKLLTALVYFGIGVVIGLVSLLFFPKAFVRSESLHGISLVITPVLAGLVMNAIGWIRVRQGELAIQIERFSYGFALAFGMALIRFYFTD
jgi:VIT1/CCC1 family predicted Fe2+/Mn2+ transporter